MITNYILNKDYSILNIKLFFIRLVWQMCVNGSVKKNPGKLIPFKRTVEIPRAKEEWANYIEEKRNPA